MISTRPFNVRAGNASFQPVGGAHRSAKTLPTPKPRLLPPRKLYRPLDPIRVGSGVHCNEPPHLIKAGNISKRSKSPLSANLDEIPRWEFIHDLLSTKSISIRIASSISRARFAIKSHDAARALEILNGANNFIHPHELIDKLERYRMSSNCPQVARFTALLREVAEFIEFRAKLLVKDHPVVAAAKYALALEILDNIGGDQKKMAQLSMLHARLLARLPEYSVDAVGSLISSARRWNAIHEMGSDASLAARNEMKLLLSASPLAVAAVRCAIDSGDSDSIQSSVESVYSIWSRILLAAGSLPEIEMAMYQLSVKAADLRSAAKNLCTENLHHHGSRLYALLVAIDNLYSAPSEMDRTIDADMVRAVDATITSAVTSSFEQFRASINSVFAMLDLLIERNVERGDILNAMIHIDRAISMSSDVKDNARLTGYRVRKLQLRETVADLSGLAGNSLVAAKMFLDAGKIEDAIGVLSMAVYVDPVAVSKSKQFLELLDSSLRGVTSLELDNGTLAKALYKMLSDGISEMVKKIVGSFDQPTVAAMGKAIEAMERIELAAKRRYEVAAFPEMAGVHMKLGVALAEQVKYREASVEFSNAAALYTRIIEHADSEAEKIQAFETKITALDSILSALEPSQSISRILKAKYHLFLKIRAEALTEKAKLSRSSIDIELARIANSYLKAVISHASGFSN